MVRYFLDQILPVLESTPARKLRVEHSTGAMPQLGNAVGIGAQALQRIGKQLAFAGLDDDPAIMLPDEPCDFPVARGDRDDRSAGGGDPIELAWHD